MPFRRVHSDGKLDGTENLSAILDIAMINPNLDSLQDFKMSTSNYDAEFGSAAGALLQAATTSGSNQIHPGLRQTRLFLYAQDSWARYSEAHHQRAALRRLFAADCRETG